MWHNQNPHLCPIALVLLQALLQRLDVAGAQLGQLLALQHQQLWGFKECEETVYSMFCSTQGPTGSWDCCIGWISRPAWQLRAHLLHSVTLPILQLPSAL